MFEFVGLSDQTTHSMSQDEVPPISRKLVEGILRENTMLKQQVSQPQKVEELTMVSFILKDSVVFSNVKCCGVMS